MSLPHEAYKELFNQEPTKELSLRYSGHFSPFNANVQYNSDFIKFKLSNDWKQVSPEIKKGLLQNLLAKMKKTSTITLHMELYEKFYKNLSKYRPATETDPFLEESFSRLNEDYFHGMMEKPNLVWGQPSTSKLGSFDFGSNTITISTIFKQHEELLDYVMYHEMLHKKHKYTLKKGRSHSHTKEFRDEEKKFKTPDMEQQLKTFLAKHKVKKFLKFW